MENIKIGLFDLFAYIIPGVLTMLSIFILQNTDGTCFDLHKISSLELNFVIAAILIIVSYIVGFITSMFGDFLLSLVEKIKFLKQPIPIHYLPSVVNESTKYCLVRELAPKNFINIEQFNVLKKMTSNLSVVFFIFSIALFFCIVNFSYWHLVAGVILSGLFLKSSWKFHRWVIIDLDNTVFILNLLENINKNTKK